MKRSSKFVLLLVSVLTSTLFFCACNSSQMHAVAQLTGGDPRSGREKMMHYGCPACHQIPGIQTAVGQVGPPLDHIARRTYLAGELPNTPQNMVRWIEKPRDLEPHTAMPDMGVTDVDARDISAYLYSLN